MSHDLDPMPPGPVQARGPDWPAGRLLRSKEAGARLTALLSLGASNPWQDALAQLSGKRDADGTAILAHFAPLKTCLEQQNQGESCSW